MPKLGMEPIRRAALVKAAIFEIGQAGSLSVTVAQIARRAGVSSALAHHYFGAKEHLFLAAMRHILSVFGAQARLGLAVAKTPRARLEAIVHASFEAGNFRPEVIAAWLNFYVQAQTSPEAARLLRVYQARLRSNLVHALRPLAGARAAELAGRTGALIDGVFIRQALKAGALEPEGAVRMVLGYLDAELGKVVPG